MDLSQALENSTGYNRFNTNSPITEVAENSKKTVDLLNKIQCNTNLQNSAIDFNTNEQFVVTDTNSLTLSANTYHSISYVVLSGTANITVGETLLSGVPAGYSNYFEATTLLTNSIIFTGLSSGTKIGITTLK